MLSNLPRGFQLYGVHSYRYGLFNHGLDITPLLEHFPESVQESSQGGALAMAFVTNKIIAPLRTIGTLTITPPLAHHLERRGHTWFKTDLK